MSEHDYVTEVATRVLPLDSDVRDRVVREAMHWWSDCYGGWGERTRAWLTVERVVWALVEEGVITLPEEGP